MKDFTETILLIKGMDCTNCALGIKKQLIKQGYKDVEVNFATAEVRFYDASEEEVSRAVALINSMGYRAYLPEKEIVSIKKTIFNNIELKFWFSLIFTFPLLISMFIAWSVLHQPYVQLTLCLPVYLLGMWHFGKSAFFSVRSGVPNMDVLITLGSSAAFFYSLTGTVLQLGHNYQFYETAAGIITLIFLGNLLEHKAILKTTSAIDDLLKLQRVKAHRQEIIKNKEYYHDVDATELKSNDVVLVNNGEQVPADGIIIWGMAAVDESLITGEASSVEKRVGDKVVGGSILLDGTIKVNIKETGSASVLGQIIDLVKNAQNSKPKLQNLADKISAVFVPVVLIVSFLTFLLNYFFAEVETGVALLRSIAVLVIACPCALGLAIPTAVIIGIGNAAKKGILIKGAANIQTLLYVKHVFFDKTGTLTNSNFEISKTETYGITEMQALSLLFSIERFSTHPMAKSVVQSIKDANITEFVEIHEEKGVGIKATDSNGNVYLAGSSVVFPQADEFPFHNIYLLKNNQLIATFDFSDEIKPNAGNLISFLKTMNITPVMLSGDNSEACNRIAFQTGIETVYASKSPAEKLEIIRQYQNNGITAMVGDGINDAPALALAGIGISLGNATSAAINSAQVVLLGNNLNLLKDAFLISYETVKVIKQNLFWAFIYNILAIPIAAAGFLNPMVAALSMALSDIIVVLNSLRLNRKLKNLK